MLPKTKKVKKELYDESKRKLRKKTKYGKSSNKGKEEKTKIEKQRGSLGGSI